MVAGKLIAAFPDETIEIVPITTGGDKVVDRPIAEIGTRGVFVKELEDALLNNEVELVVHSLKDMPTDVPPGLSLIAVLERTDPRDVLATSDGSTFAQLKQGATVATSSRRRAAQLGAARKDLKFIDIRGNIETRLRKLDEGYCDATILAAAGLLRLELQERISQTFEPHELCPAAGQGALAVECRSDDAQTIAKLLQIDDPIVRSETDCERAFLAHLGGGCSVPIGALARIGSNEQLTLEGCIAALDGSQVFRKSMTGTRDRAEELGRKLAESMLKEGAQPVVEQLRLSVPNSISPP